MNDIQWKSDKQIDCKLTVTQDIADTVTTASRLNVGFSYSSNSAE